MAERKGVSPETIRKIRLWILALRNTRIIMILVGAGFLAYASWDSLFVPKLSEMEGLETQLTTQQEQANLVNTTEETIKRTRKELESFKPSVPLVKPGESSQVVSVSLSKRVLDILSGQQPRVIGTSFAAPFSALKIKGVESLEPETLEVSAVIPEIKAIKQTLKLWRFGYEITAEGNYLALVDALNEILAMDVIVSLDKLSLKPAGSPSFKAEYPKVSPGASGPTSAPASGVGIALPDFNSLMTPGSPPSGASGEEETRKSVVPLEITLGISVFVADPSIQ